MTDAPRTRNRRGAGTIYQTSADTWWIRRSQIVEGQRERWSDGPFRSSAEAERVRASGTAHTVERRDLTWKKWLEHFSAEQVQELTETGQDAYAAILEREVRVYLVPSIGHIRLADTTTEHFVNLWRTLLRKGTSPKYVQNIRSAAHLACVEAISRGLLSSDVVGESAIPRARKIPKAEETDKVTVESKNSIANRILYLVLNSASPPGGEACVCDLTEQVGLTQPTVSHHLKLLVDAGLITREQRGRWSYHRIDQAALDALAETLRTSVA